MSQARTHNTRLGFGEDDLYRSEDWSTFHNLVTHDGATGKDAPELMMQALVAVFLLRALKFKNYFGENDSNNNNNSNTNNRKQQFNDLELDLCLLLHHYMRAAFYNTHEVTRIEDETSMKRIGRATNPTLALINHSCDPNYRRISKGRITFGFATKFIAKGGEILDTYAQTFDSKPKGERMKYLEKYNFKCLCLACKEDWPTLAGGGINKKLSGLDKTQYMITDPSAIKAGIKKVEKIEKQVEKMRGTRKEKMSHLLELLGVQKTLCMELSGLVRAPHYKICLAESNLYQTLLLCTMVQ